MTDFTFLEEDNNDCRVYYRKDNRLFCWQDDGSFGRKEWKFYACSRDGEPSHAILPQITPPCPAETTIGQELNAFLKGQPR